MVMFLSLMIPLLFFSASLVLDLQSFYAERTRLQSVLDGALLTSARSLPVFNKAKIALSSALSEAKFAPETVQISGDSNRLSASISSQVQSRLASALGVQQLLRASVSRLITAVRQSRSEVREAPAGESLSRQTYAR